MHVLATGVIFDVPLIIIKVVYWFVHNRAQTVLQKGVNSRLPLPQPVFQWRTKHTWKTVLGTTVCGSGLQCSADEVSQIGCLWDSSTAFHRDAAHSAVSADRAGFQNQRGGMLVSITVFLSALTHTHTLQLNSPTCEPTTTDIQTFLSAPAGVFLGIWSWVS